MPITWRNVEGPNMGQAIWGMDIARKGLTDSLQGVVDTQKGFVTDARDRNTQAFLDEMNRRWTSPEELEAARASGAIDALRQSYGNRIDAEKVRGADLNLLGKLIESRTAANTYNDAEALREQRPAYEQAMAAAYQGNAQAVNDVLAANPNLRNVDDIFKTLTPEVRAQELHGDTRAQNKITREGGNLVNDLRGLEVEAKTLGQNQTIASQQILDAFSSTMLQAQQARSAGQPVPDDTTLLLQTRDQLLRDGYSPAQVNAAAQQLAPGFSSIAPLAGTDLNAALVEEERNAADMQRRLASNPIWNAPPSVAARINAMDGWFKTFSDQLTEKGWHPSELGDAHKMVQQMMQESFTATIDVPQPDGTYKKKEVTYTAVPEDVQALLPGFIRESRIWGEDPVLDSGFKAAFREYMLSPQRVRMQQEYEVLAGQAGVRGRNNLINAQQLPKKEPKK